MVMQQNHSFDLTLKFAVVPAFIVVALMWAIFLIDYILPVNLYEWGVLAQTREGLKGILFMPLIHSTEDFKHIFNNSVPTFILITALFYSYKPIATKVFLWSWILTGLFVWIFAAQTKSYHVGMSGIIYSLVGFLFTSGVIRRFFPLQALSLVVVFLYGSLIWGIFPIEPRVSWQGHLMGLMVGIWLAFYFRNEGPKRPKYQYEIEKEMGIEPPDLEGMYLERLRQLEVQQKEQEDFQNRNTVQVVYHIVPSENREGNAVNDPNNEKK
jgi:membrane associated rhomboid family serine protease